MRTNAKTALIAALIAATTLATLTPSAEATNISWQQAGTILAARLNDRAAREYHEELGQLLIASTERVAKAKVTPREGWTFDAQHCRLTGGSADLKVIVNMKKLKEAVPVGPTRLDLKCEPGVQCVSVLKRQGNTWASSKAYGVNRHFKNTQRKAVVRNMVRKVYASCGPGGRA